MRHSIKKVIKRSVPPEEVKKTLKVRFAGAGRSFPTLFGLVWRLLTAPRDQVLEITGFDRKVVCGMQPKHNFYCTARVRFLVEQKEDKTILTAEITIRRKLFWFWLVFPFSIWRGSTGMVSIIQAIEKGLNETVAELE